MSDAAGDSATDVRRDLRASSDPRVDRTRRLLFSAAQTLSDSATPFSVTALVREAGVSRSVFYTHFADLGELALCMLEPAIEEIAAHAASVRDRDPHDSMRDAQVRLASHMDEHRALYRAAFLLPDNGLLTRMRDVMADALALHIASAPLPVGLRADIVSRYVAGAATHLLADWTTGSITSSSLVIARHLYELMPRWMHEPPFEPSTETTEEERESP